MPQRKAFEEIEHTADLAFRAYGRDLAELFEHAARAVFALEGGATAPAQGEVQRLVEVNGVDRETLLVNWLNELLYLQEARGESYTDFKVEGLSDTHLRAQIRGFRGGARKKIKAVTFHNLAIEPTNEGWQATVVVDV